MNTDKSIQTLKAWLEYNMRQPSLNHSTKQDKIQMIQERLRPILGSTQKLTATQILLLLQKSRPLPTAHEIKRDRADRVRKCNADAARRSRLRKNLKMETMETRAKDLQVENGRLRVQVAVLESDVNNLLEKREINNQRVLDLEAQLATVHQQLTDV